MLVPCDMEPQLAQLYGPEWLQPEKKWMWNKSTKNFDVLGETWPAAAGICPAAEGRGAFDIVRENVTRSVCLSVSLSLCLSLCLSIPRAPKREFGTD